MYINSSKKKVVKDAEAGKELRYKDTTSPSRDGIFIVIECQEVWGCDVDGKFTLVPGYLIARRDGSDARCCRMVDVTFIKET